MAGRVAAAVGVQAGGVGALALAVVQVELDGHAVGDAARAAIPVRVTPCPPGPPSPPPTAARPRRRPPRPASCRPGHTPASKHAPGARGRTPAPCPWPLPRA